jgi:hypothetical protein
VSAVGADRDGVLRNGDVDWHDWPVAQYISENYAQLHAADAAVIDHHSAYYQRLGADSLARSLEFGAGPNLYPLMLAAGCSRQIDALELSSANVAYLNAQLADGPDENWLPFYQRCRLGNGNLPESPAQALGRVRVIQGDGFAVEPGAYDLASMHFVAEGATADQVEFAAFCLAFIRSVRPGGHLVAAFMENLASYQLGDAPRLWPGYAVDTDKVREAFGGYTEDLMIERIESDPTLPEYGDSGMIMLTARRVGG